MGFLVIFVLPIFCRRVLFSVQLEIFRHGYLRDSPANGGAAKNLAREQYPQEQNIEQYKLDGIDLLWETLRVIRNIPDTLL